MKMWTDGLIVLMVLTGFLLLGSSRLAESIRMVALQGLVLGFLPLLIQVRGISVHLVLIGVGSMVLKGWVFPRLLLKAVRDAHIRREVQPFVGFTLSLLWGIMILWMSFWLSSRLPLPGKVPSTLVIPGALFMTLTGFFLIVSRRIAISQVLGYLVLENGVFIFGMALAQEQPWLVELGVLLDVFVAVFVMGIMIFHINREFDHIDSHRLADLKDIEP